MCSNNYDYLEKCIGEKVVHKMQGSGTVVSCNTETGVINVKFLSGVMRVKFPQSFEDGIVSFAASDEMIDSIIRESAKAHRNKKMIVQSANQKQKKTVSTQPDNHSKKKKTNSTKKGSSSGTKISKPTAPTIVKSKSKIIDNPYSWDEELQRTCNNCRSMKNGNCAGLRRAESCHSYSPVPNITRAERHNWPSQCDATAFRQGKKR